MSALLQLRYALDQNKERLLTNPAFIPSFEFAGPVAKFTKTVPVSSGLVLWDNSVADGLPTACTAFIFITDSFVTLTMEDGSGTFLLPLQAALPLMLGAPNDFIKVTATNASATAVANVTVVLGA